MHEHHEKQYAAGLAIAEESRRAAELAAQKAREFTESESGGVGDGANEKIARDSQEIAEFSLSASRKAIDRLNKANNQSRQEQLFHLRKNAEKSNETRLANLNSANRIINADFSKAANEAGKRGIKNLSERELKKQAAKRASKQAAKKAAQKVAVEKASQAAAAKAGVAVAGGFASGGTVTLIMLAISVVKWFAKPKNTLMFLMVGGMIFLMFPIVLAFVVISSVMYPFNVVFTFINGIFSPTPVESFGESISYYIGLEKEAAQEDIAAFCSQRSSGADNYTKPPLLDGMEDEYNTARNRDRDNQESYWAAMSGGTPTYTYTDPITGEQREANVSDGEPPYDDSSLREEPFMPDEDGKYRVSQDQHESGDIPFIPPVYEGIRWKGTPPRDPFDKQWDKNEGVTDATSIDIPEELFVKMLATLTADRQFVPEEQITEHLNPDLVKTFFNSLPFWTWSSVIEIYYCEGCFEYSWYEVQEKDKSTDYDEDLGTDVTSYTITAVEHVEKICPGHVYNRLDIQLDSNPLINIPEEYYNMDRVWDMLWGTPKQGETQEDADKRREEGVKTQKEIEEQMLKDLEDYKNQ